MPPHLTWGHFCTLEYRCIVRRCSKGQYAPQPALGIRIELEVRQDQSLAVLVEVLEIGFGIHPIQWFLAVKHTQTIALAIAFVVSQS